MPQLTLDFLARQATHEAPVAPDGRQRQLTGRLLKPHLKALEADLLRLRAEYDETIAQQSDPNLARYPIGFCLEICKGVLALIQRELAAPTTPGIKALHRFIAEGGLAKRVWGDLRGQYFQNAIQIGSLYVDVANDSVNPAKPKIEILPLHQAGFQALSDYDSYARLAESYWHARVYPNRYLPHLAPLYPLLLVYPSGKIQLHSSYQTMLYQNLLSDFALAEQALFQGGWRDRRLPEADLLRLEQAVRQLPSPGANFHPETVDDASLASIFRKVRASQLRLDAERCQVLLDLARKLGGGIEAQPI